MCACSHWIPVGFIRRPTASSNASAITTTSQIEMLMPDAQDVQDLVSRKGLFSFYRDGHQECCAIRKIKPLRRQLAGLDAWITGQRRDQSVTRTECADRAGRRGVFDGRSPRRQIQSAGRLDFRRRVGATSAPTTCRTTRCTMPAS